MSRALVLALFMGTLAGGSWVGLGKPTFADGRAWAEAAKARADATAQAKADASANAIPMMCLFYRTRRRLSVLGCRANLFACLRSKRAQRDFR